MAKLTALEIEAVLAAAGNCDVPAMFEDEPDRARAARLTAAYERGMDKLRATLDRRADRIAAAQGRRRNAARIDGMDRDDLGEKPGFLKGGQAQ